MAVSFFERLMGRSSPAAPPSATDGPNSLDKKAESEPARSNTRPTPTADSVERPAVRAEPPSGSSAPASDDKRESADRPTPRSWSSFGDSDWDSGDDDGPRRSSGLFGGGLFSGTSSYFSSKTAHEALAADAPVALTAAAARAGAVPPPGAKLFGGASVVVTHDDKDETKTHGTLVGYDTSGRPLVQAAGKDTASAIRGFKSVTLAPAQEFRSALQTVPAAHLYTPTATEQQALDALLATPVGSIGDGKTVRDYMQAIRDAGFEVFIAGGAVRDALSGKTPRDVDLATTMWCDDVRSTLGAATLDRGWSNTSFGTLLVSRSSNGLDICSFKRASGEFGFDIMADAKYRDFTFNALYYDPFSGVIADPIGTGVADAKARTIRPACSKGDEQGWLARNSSAPIRLLKFTLRGYKPMAPLLQLCLDNFRSCMASNGTFRNSRMKESVGADEAAVVAEMKRLGFRDEDIRAVYPGYGLPPPRFMADDDSSGPRSWGRSLWSRDTSPTGTAGRAATDSTPATPGTRDTASSSTSDARPRTGMRGDTRWEEIGPGRFRLRYGSSSTSSSTPKSGDSD